MLEIPHLQRSRGYLPPTERKTAFLSPWNYKTIFSSRKHTHLFVLGKIIIGIAALCFFQFLPLLLAAILSSGLLVITSLFDKELVREVNAANRLVPEALPKAMPEGWYADPWALGKLHQERYWNGAEWETKTRTVDAVKTEK